MASRFVHYKQKKKKKNSGIFAHVIFFSRRFLRQDGFRRHAKMVCVCNETTAVVVFGDPEKSLLLLLHPLIPRPVKNRSAEIYVST